MCIKNRVKNSLCHRFFVADEFARQSWKCRRPNSPFRISRTSDPWCDGWASWINSWRVSTAPAGFSPMSPLCVFFRVHPEVRHRGGSQGAGGETGRLLFWELHVGLFGGRGSGHGVVVKGAVQFPSAHNRQSFPKEQKLSAIFIFKREQFFYSNARIFIATQGFAVWYCKNINPYLGIHAHLSPLPSSLPESLFRSERSASFISPICGGFPRGFHSACPDWAVRRRRRKEDRRNTLAFPFLSLLNTLLLRGASPRRRQRTAGWPDPLDVWAVSTAEGVDSYLCLSVTVNLFYTRLPRSCHSNDHVQWAEDRSASTCSWRDCRCCRWPLWQDCPLQTCWHTPHTHHQTTDASNHGNTTACVWI